MASTYSMTIEITLIAFCVAILILNAVTMAFAISAKIEVEAMKRSTHSIQYVPADQLKSFSMNDEFMKQEAGGFTDDQIAALTKDSFENL